MKQIDILSHVKGCTVYVCDENGIPEAEPVTIDAEISLPQITHPTATIQSMGDMDVPDQTRVNPMTLGIGCELSVIQTKIVGYGVKSYIIRWGQEVKKANGSFDLVPFIVYASGIPSEDVSVTVRPGENTTGTVNIACLKYRVVVDGEEIRYIDKTQGVLKIGKEDFRAKLNAML